MSRYTGPRVRKARRYGAPIFANVAVAKSRKQNPPGPPPTRRKKISDRGLQLIEKQKVRFAYGLVEKQFRNVYEKAVRSTAPTGDELMILLEERLDNTVYRLGFASTRDQARQLVTHGHISVKGNKLDIPSALVKIGDEISFTSRGLKSNYLKILKEEIKGRTSPGWLELDEKKLLGTVISRPNVDDIEPIFNPNAIVEYYSR
ncbi:MAG: 30S ribosomal protein S4 [Dehalococcoidaceae bacterium]|nr:30S ribosomal protein S4 [Dehalococcoidaceae bacterium]|tara:strand:- start:41599 stop:42207 length:609 start_codon:yes stop_codon:yes gene_type:complete